MFLVISFLVSVNLALAADSKIGLTKDEKAFICGHPIVRLGVDPKFVPFEFIDENGEHQGIAADYLKLIMEKKA